MSRGFADESIVMTMTTLTAMYGRPTEVLSIETLGPARAVKWHHIWLHPQYLASKDVFALKATDRDYFSFRLSDIEKDATLQRGQRAKWHRVWRLCARRLESRDNCR